MNHKKLVLLLATVTTGLSAGLFFAFSVAFNPALARLSDAEFIKTMQAINEVIENPVFFLAFFGAVILLPLAAYLYRDEIGKRFKLLILATVLYVIGCVGITMSANIPLNNTLAKVAVESSSEEELATARHDYVPPWNTWHTIRTVAAVAALGVVAASCLLTENQVRVKKRNQ
jgi:uncharacterized membrane protein